MKKVLLVGRTGSGKTSLIQSLQNRELIYRKTQTIIFTGQFVDTPGEFLENRRFYSALLVSSAKCDMIGLIQDATCSGSAYPPKFASMFKQKALGIVTKVDKQTGDPARAERFLRQAGTEIIIRTSVIDGTGLELLREYLAQGEMNGV